MEDKLLGVYLRALVQYLDRTGSISEIERLATEYVRSYEESEQSYLIPPLQYGVTMDLTEVSDVSGELAEIILQEPYRAQDILLDIVHSSIQVLTNSYEFPEEQVDVTMRIEVPPIPQLTEDAKVRERKGLFVIQGILAAYSSPIKEFKSSVFACELLRCSGIDKQRTRRPQEICVECGQKLKEISKARHSIEKVYGMMIPKNNSNQESQSCYKYCHKVVFTEEQCNNLELGASYTLSVSRDKDGLKVWGMQPLLSQSSVRAAMGLPLIPFSPELKSFVESVKSVNPSSMWALVNALTASFASDIYPLTGLIHLKAGLLLSLASTGSKTPVPVLALGEGGSLMSRGTRLSSNSLYVNTSLVGVLPTPSHPYMFAGPLLLANQGVCYLGHCPKNNNSFLNDVMAAIESDIVKPIPSKTLPNPGPEVHPLRTCVWMFWNFDKHSAQDMKKIRTLVDIFGVPFLTEIGPSDEEMSSFILQPPSQIPLLPDSAIKEYLEAVSAQEVTMGPLATALIKNYFVASRRERPDCLPVRAIKTLTGLSEAHTRMSLRDTVTYEDVVAAIYLYEEAISELFGPSIVGTRPSRELDECQDLVVYLERMDKVLTEFSLWLDKYIKSLTTGNSAMSTSQLS